MSTNGTPGPWTASLAVTCGLLGLVVLLVFRGGYDGLAGTVTGLIAGYWLPTRPNRAPPA